MSIAHQPATPTFPIPTRLGSSLFPTFPRWRARTLAKIAGLVLVSAVGIAAAVGVALGSMLLLVTTLFG